MARNALFTSTWARCPEHGTLLEPNESQCMNCKIIERNLSLIPPFPVYSKMSYWGKFETGHVYTVFWVVRDATNQFGNKLSGYVFENEDKSVWEHVANPL